MNNLDLNSLFSDIYSSCEEISVIANKAVLNRNRSSLLGNCAAQISTGLSDLKRNNLQKNPRILDALLLLAICLEDVKSFLEKFSALNQELAIAVVKGGSHCLEFVKLTEQLHHCCELVHLDIHIPEDDAFETDCADLVARLPSVLQHLFSKANTSTVLPFISKCKNLINAQRAIKNTYKGKRSRNEDVTMKSDDLQMVKPVGRGGFSTVWLGKYRGEDVAVKVLSVEATSKTLAEFQHEADLMRRLSNKNIVAYYGIMEIDNGKISGHCMIMEYMVNDSLFTFIKANKSAEMVWAKKVDIALDVASGIAFLHRLRIIHRDIKLGNILLDEHLQAKVADFGLSFTKTANNSIYTMNEGGTIPYMAPECFGGNASYSTKSDVFAFAIVCWGILHWELPFTDYDRDLIKDMVWKERFRLPIDKKIPVALSSMVKLCWAQNYTHRPTMVEVKSFLENVVFIDGLYTENPRFDIEMTTTATIQDKDSFSGPSSLRAAKEESRLPFEVVSQAPYVKNTGKLPEKTVLRERRKFYCVIALLSLIIVIGAAGGVFAYFSFGKSTNETFFVPSSPTVALVIQTTTSIGPYVNPSVTGQNSVLSSATAAETPIIFASDSQSLIASVSDFSTSSTQTPNTSQMPIFFASDTNSLVGPASGFSTSSTQTPTTSATTIFFASDSQSLIASVSVVSTSSTQTPTTSETPIFFATDTQSLIGTSSSSAHAPTNSYATNIDTTSTQSFFMSSSAANNPATSLTTTSNLQTTTSAVQTTRSTSIRTITRTASPTATVTTIISDDAALNQIHGITIDENDNIYVIAPNKRVINKITFNGTAAVMEKIANLSTDGQSGSYDQGICYFNNALYVPRWGQLTKIDLANNNLVTRFAGSGIPGGVNPGQNSSATFCGAISCTIDNQGNIYVAEECNAIRKVNQTGYVSNVGLGLPIKPNSLLIKNDSTLLFTGWYPTVIYSIGLINSQVTALTMDSVAGNSGMIYDELGNLYVAETERHGIAKFNATTYSSIQFAGYTSSGKHDDVGSAARFNKPRQIAIDTKGRLFVADQNNNAIRMITW